MPKIPPSDGHRDQAEIYERRTDCEDDGVGVTHVVPCELQVDATYREPKE